MSKLSWGGMDMTNPNCMFFVANMIIGPRVRIRVILNQILSERDTQTLCFLTISNESPCVPHLKICCRHAQPIPSKARRKVNAMISGLVWDLRPCSNRPVRVELTKSILQFKHEKIIHIDSKIKNPHCMDLTLSPSMVLACRGWKSDPLEIVFSCRV